MSQFGALISTDLEINNHYMIHLLSKSMDIFLFSLFYRIEIQTLQKVV